MKKRIVILLLALSLASTSLTGCIKVVKIGDEAALTGEEIFSAGDNVTSFWESKALPELGEKAVDLGTLLTEANGDLKSVADKYGKFSMGDSGELTYTVKGNVTVQEVEAEKKAGFMTVSLEGYSGPEEIKMQIGSVIKGSAVRDALSFIKFGDYTNQEEYAQVSQSIHAVIQETVINPEMAKGLKGKTIEFTGCFSVSDNTSILITPISITEK